MNILFTICGRAGSKGVKGKNVRDFCGIPLLWYTLACIKLYIDKYGAPDDIIDIALNTDSDRLMDLADGARGLSIAKLWRNESLGGDTVPKVSVIYDCLERASEISGRNYDMVVDLDITSPLRTVDDVHNAIERKTQRTDVDVVYSVTHARRNPYFNMVKQDDGFFCKAIPSDYTTRQQSPVFYDMNASIYAYSPVALRDKPRATFFNNGCDAIMMFDTGILDIDSEDDYNLMQVIARYLYETKPEYRQIYLEALSWL